MVTIIGYDEERHEPATEPGTGLVGALEIRPMSNVFCRPESRLKYSNAAIGAVGYVLEVTQKQPFERLIQERVLGPQKPQTPHQGADVRIILPTRFSLLHETRQTLVRRALQKLADALRIARHQSP